MTDAQSQAGDLAVVMLSATGTAGFNVAGVTIPLTFDGLTGVTLSVLPAFSATVDTAGNALTAPVPVPRLPIGLTFWAAAATLKGFNITSVADPIRFQSQ